jgi:hypothetical protein
VSLATMLLDPKKKKKKLKTFYFSIINFINKSHPRIFVNIRKYFNTHGLLA